MQRIWLLMLSLLFVLSVTLSGEAVDVGVNIDIAAPPPLEFAGPPDMVVVPSGENYVYMMPNMTGVYFYGGSWYRFHRGYWFRSSVYNGSWGPIETSIVPGVIVSVPPEYPRYLPHGYHRIHYNDLHSHWRDWDSGHHWHGYDWYKHESRAEVRHERERSIESGRLSSRRPTGEQIERKGRAEQRTGTREYREGKALEGRGARQETVGRRQEAVGTREYNEGLSKQNKARQLQREGKSGDAKALMKEGKREERQGAGEIKRGTHNVAQGGRKEAVGHNEAKQGAHEVKKGSRDVARGERKEKRNQ